MHLAGKAINLLAMKQQLSGSGWLVTHVAASVIAGYVSIQQPQFPGLRFYIGISQAYPAGSDGFYLGAGKDDAGFHAIADMVIMICLPVSS